jgi:zinc D-Ala-D-Ala carboxypeptidase
VADVQLTANFKQSELACKCGCGVFNIRREDLLRLQRLRDAWGKPMKINSACRCPANNVTAGGAPLSRHVTTAIQPGKAFDVALSNSADRHRFIALAIAQGAKGIGIANSFVHVDWDETRPAPLIWLY